MDNEEIEILYNNCYGGWRISNKARKLYALRKILIIYLCEVILY